MMRNKINDVDSVRDLRQAFEVQATLMEHTHTHSLWDDETHTHAHHKLISQS